MAQKYTKILVSLFFILSALMISCGEDQEIIIESGASKSIESSDIKSIQGLPPGIPSFPHLFSGNFFIIWRSGNQNWL